ncbi:MAG TPA: hypothetical protein VFG87_22515 [Amycolatopsis sp.]|nr:hypothetical protein [Amycolatopsis sp.]
MSSNRGRRLDRQSAERILRGDRVTGEPALRALLAAAAAPARDGEQAGEQAAVAAFQAARLTPVPRPRSRLVLRTTLARVLTTRLAVVGAAAAAVTAGGVVAVAATGGLPGGGSGSGSGSVSVPAATSAAVPGGEAGATAAPKSDNAATEKSAAAASPGPSASLSGLCHAYTADAGVDHGKALDSPAFTVLIDTAGGRDKVDGYCATVLGEHPGNPGGTGGTASSVPPGKDNGAGAHGAQDPKTHADR